jgi:hypothetical protein
MGAVRRHTTHQAVQEATMRLFSLLVTLVTAGVLVAAPALAQTPVSPFSTPPFGTPSTLSPGLAPPINPSVTPSMTGGIPGTLGGTPNVGGSAITGGIPGTLGATPFQAGGSITGALPAPSTFGTTGTSSTSPLGAGALGGATGTGR